MNFVCPECHSPYIATTVMATAKINHCFDWELEYLTPDELADAIQSPDTHVTCPACDWSGYYSELISTVVEGTDGIQYDTGVPAVSATILDVAPIIGKFEPLKIGVGMMVELATSLYRVIGIVNGPRAAHLVANENGVSICINELHPSTLVMLVAIEDGTPTSRYSCFTWNQLNNQYQLGHMTPIERLKSSVPYEDGLKFPELGDPEY